MDKLNTPILFLIFNRPDTTARVFAEIRKAKPKRLFVVADGPRNEEEREKCEAARAVIEQVDWDCEVKKNYSEENLGCKIRVSSGIDWFFENVEQGIILEDDCLPSQSFFPFCEELLERYKDDKRIGYITGNNFFHQTGDKEYSYHFSKFGPIWGWATWKRAWNKYDITLNNFVFLLNNKGFLLKSLYYTEEEYRVWKKRLLSVLQNKVNTWDFQWAFTQRINNFLVIKPNKNLVSNIGFSADATHTVYSAQNEYLRKSEINFPLKHPDFIFPDKETDLKQLEKTIHTSRHIKIKSFIYKIIITKPQKTLFALKNKLLLSSKIRRFNLSGKKRVLVIGDSHSEIFLNKEIHGFLREYQMNVVSVGGATISGLNNPNSKTNAKRIFEYAIKKVGPEILIFLLGEVDVGFLIWHKKETENLTVDEIYENSLNRYKKFVLESIQKTGAAKTIIISIPLPTIKEYLPGNEISNLRSKIKATYQQRKDLTNKFNHDLSQFCRKKGLIFLDLTKDVIDKNGDIKNEFLSNSGLDHHYDKTNYANLIIKKLLEEIK